MPDLPEHGYRLLSTYDSQSPAYRAKSRLVEKQIEARDTLGPLLKIAGLEIGEYVELAQQYGTDAVKKAIGDYGREFRVALGPDVQMVE